ncbi:MAG: NAD(+) synthase [Patescibacteria group bacterium]
MSNSEILITKLQRFFADRKFQKAVVGLSGGVDSALTLALAVRALGAENVFGLILPRKNISSDESKILAEKVAQKFGVQTFEFEIGALIEKFSPPWKQNSLAEINLAPRIRMLTIYNFANAQNALVLGTSNKSEILLGYGTKFGDFAADVEVLGNLFKTEVFELAKELEVPSEIINRAPTAELHAGQTDESELGANYQILDEILIRLEKNNFALAKNATELEKKILQRVLENKHKTELTPLL